MWWVVLGGVTVLFAVLLYLDTRDQGLTLGTLAMFGPPWLLTWAKMSSAGRAEWFPVLAAWLVLALLMGTGWHPVRLVPVAMLPTGFMKTSQHYNGQEAFLGVLLFGIGATVIYFLLMPRLQL